MKRLLNILARIIAIVCAILFVAAALAALFLYNLEQRAFNPNIYKEALSNENFSQSLPSLLGQVLVKDSSESNSPFVKQLTSENWATIIQTLLPPEQLRNMTEESITQIFAYLNNETSDPHISLLPLKQRLAGPAGMDAIIGLIHAQPNCTPKQDAEMISTLGPVLCNPPQNVLNWAKPILQAQLSSDGGKYSRSNINHRNKHSIAEDEKSQGHSIGYAAQSTASTGTPICCDDLRSADIQRLDGMVGLAAVFRRCDRRDLRLQRGALVSSELLKITFQHARN